MAESTDGAARGSNFIRTIVEQDLRSGKHAGVVTRFPPEPNGYLHIGHVKSICLNFGIAAEFGGRCHLRYDDTNPLVEDVEYVRAIERDIRWLGFDWGEHLHHASDYFEQLFAWALELVDAGLAYVCSLSEEDIRAYRGTVTEPGRPSPDRDRPPAESRALLEQMKAGAFPEGTYTLRAKIDMSHPNMKMRDPLIYRIRRATHHRTGNTWSIYPMYDFAHGLSDAIEHITHSLCTLEFENNRELYDWFVDHVSTPSKPRQIEFARLNLAWTVMSKRKLLALVKEGHVSGWDDPRMPTIAGLRRRGYTPASLRSFAERVGVAKANSTVDMALLENAVRDDLNDKAPRVMAVLDPLRVVIDNWDEGEVDWLDASYWPHDVPREGSRRIPFSKVLYIERDDFREDPPKKFFRLAPGREVRLRYGYLITCTGVERDSEGRVVALRCTVDRDSRGGNPSDGRKVKGTLHWVSAEHAVEAEVRLYDRLFTVPDPDAGGADFREHLNPGSLRSVTAFVEPSLANAEAGAHFQFERTGYFFVDPVDGVDGPVFNRVVPLKDSWAKVAKTAAPPARREPTPRAAKGAPKQAPVSVTPPADPAMRAAFDRYTGAHGLSHEDAAILTADPSLAALFDAAVSAHDNPQAIANWVVNEVLREVKERSVGDLPFDGAALGALVGLVDAGTISGKIAKDVFAEMVSTGADPKEIVTRRGLTQISDRGAIEAIVSEVLAGSPDRVEAYRGGRVGLMGYFVGQVMQRTGGRANPKLVKELLEAALR